MRYDVKSIMIGRKPRGENRFKTAFIKFFDTDEPLSPEVLPLEEKDYPNIREIVVKDFDIHYLLEGNDLLILDIDHINIEEDKEKNILTIFN